MKNARKLLLVIGVFGVGACASLPFLRQTPQQFHTTTPSEKNELPWRDGRDGVLLEVHSDSESPADVWMKDKEAPYAGLHSGDHENPSIGDDDDRWESRRQVPEFSSSFPSVPHSDSKQGANIEVKRAAVAADRAIVRHRVRDGDTLQSLAEKYLGDGSRSKEIFEANREVLTSPETLPINVELVIPVD